MARLEELEQQIFNSIASLRNRKREPNKDTIARYLRLRQLINH